MSQQFRPFDSRDQIFPMPPSLKDWLPKDPLAFFISEIMDELDLSLIFDEYKSARDQPGYDPFILICLLAYGYCTKSHNPN